MTQAEIEARMNRDEDAAVAQFNLGEILKLALSNLPNLGPGTAMLAEMVEIIVGQTGVELFRCGYAKGVGDGLQLGDDIALSQTQTPTGTIN